MIFWSFFLSFSFFSPMKFKKKEVPVNVFISSVQTCVPDNCACVARILLKQQEWQKVKTYETEGILTVFLNTESDKGVEENQTRNGNRGKSKFGTKATHWRNVRHGKKQSVRRERTGEKERPKEKKKRYEKGRWEKEWEFGHLRERRTVAGSTLEGRVDSNCFRVSSCRRSWARLTAAITSSSIALGPSFPIDGLTLRLTIRPFPESVARTRPWPASPTTSVEESARVAWKSAVRTADCRANVFGMTSGDMMCL